jgi:hypothetical protein
MRIVKGLLLLVAVWIALAAAFSGCTCVVNNYHYGTASPPAMFVANAPPPAKAETQTAAPSGDHVWINGHWEWSSSEETWIWAPGIWVLPPDDGATWVDPGYEDNNGDWMYTPGHWRWNDPGADEGPGASTPMLPPADLKWGDKRAVDAPDGGEPAVPAKPIVSPGEQSSGGAEAQPKAEGAGPATPMGPGLAAVEPKDEVEPGGRRAEERAKPRDEAGRTDLGTEDPYAPEDGEDDGDDNGKKLKKKKAKKEKAEVARTYEGKPEEETPKPPKPHNTAIEGAPKEPEAVRQSDDEQPAPKSGKKHKAKSGKKVDDADATKARTDDVTKVKGPDKIKTHQ